MRLFVAGLLACVLLPAAPSLALAEEPGPLASAPSTSPHRLDRGIGPIAAAAAREVTALSTTAGYAPLREREAPTIRRNAQKWSSRHPIAAGILFGAAGGFVVGIAAEKVGDGPSFVTRRDLVLMTTAVGAGVGAVVGIVVAIAR